MKTNKSLSFLIYLFLTAVILIPDYADAIPAFARRYKISCTTCHSVFPRLKAYGDEFAGNGFIMKENENARDYVSAGDDLLWLNKDFPVAVRMEMFAAHEENMDVKNDLQSPWGVKLLSGGNLYKNIGYYFYFYMYEGGEIAGIEDAYIHFDNIFDSNLDIMAGQFQTCDPLMKRELRLTYEDYLIYKFKPGYSNINLTYDRGVMMVYGIEKTSTDIIGMIVNGNGKPEAGEEGKMDHDNYKNVGIRVKQSIGDMLSIGGFYYLGKEKGIDSVSRTNEVTYYGPDVTFSAGPVEFTGQYMFRKDTNPMFIPNPSDLETTGLAAELVYSPHLEKSRYFFTGLYNLIDSDNYKYNTATLSYTYLLSRNLRLMGEYTRDLENEGNRIILGVVSAF